MSTDRYQGCIHYHCPRSERLIRLIESGYKAEQIIPAMNQMIQDSEIYVFIEDLNNLVKGGRAKAASAL